MAQVGLKSHSLQGTVQPCALSHISALQIAMKFNTRNWLGLTLAFSSTVTGMATAAMQPQTLFNFQAGLGDVTGALVRGPDGNFYGTTAHGGPSGGGTVFRVTPAGVLTTLVTDQANPAGLIVGNDNLLYGMMSSGGPFASGTAFRMTPSGMLTNFAVLDGVNGRTPLGTLVLASDGNFYGTSQGGGTNDFGAVFRVTPAGVVTHTRYIETGHRRIIPTWADDF